MAYIEKQHSSRPGVTTTFTPGASAQTAAFGSQTYQIRVSNGGTLAYVLVGADPTAAAATSLLMPANTIDYFTVTPGQKCAVFGTGGTLTVTEMS